MKRPSGKFLLLWASLGSILLLFGLRFYAAFYAVPVRTWDDRNFRATASQAAGLIETPQAIKQVLLPNPVNLQGERTAGYHSWLVLSFKLAPPRADPERVPQVLNIVFLSIQAAALGLIVWLATGDAAITAALTALYLLTPFVFGINRWAMTENHALAATLIFALGMMAAMKSRLEGPKGVLLVTTLAFSFGIFSTLREHLVSSFVIATLSVIAILVSRGRKWLAAVFVGILLPYALALLSSLPPILRAARNKASVDLFFVPLGTWIEQVSIFQLGPGLVVTLALCIAYFCRAEAGVSNKTGRKRKRFYRELIPFIGTLILVLVDCVLVVASSNRSARMIAPLFTALIWLLPFWYCLLQKRGLKLPPSSAAVLGALLLVSWTFMGYQLFFAFDGGRSFALHPFKIRYEVYNHPLRLPELRSPADLHVRPRWAADLPWWKLPKDLPDN